MDPPHWLSWSAGLYTDEGFYSLDARHLVVFQHAAPGNFHDSYLSPGLSALQTILFGLFGASDLTARYLSVVLSLITIVVMWLGLRRTSGENAADFGALFLGFCPVVIFYNRMALQETPAVLFIAGAFCLRAYSETNREGVRPLLLDFCSGACGACVLLFKPLGLVALPALLLLGRRTGDRSKVISAVAGASVVTVLWFSLHYLPLHSELSRMGSYYRAHQTLPGSLRTLWLDIRRGVISGKSGVLPFLFYTMPVVIGLAIYRATSKVAVRSPLDWVLVGWLASGIAYCLVMVYAPSRYYVLFTPAAAALAGIACADMSPRARSIATVAFIAVSVAWVITAFAERSFTMQDAGIAIENLLPANSLIVGDVAPSLCLGGKLQAAPMQPGLSNDKRPIESLGATAIVLIRSKTWDGWWSSQYPGLLDPKNSLGAWTVGPGYRIELFRARTTPARSR
jgi:4-amino-4-deoxy-L-arabinose transferase-like glycosyltransferase